MYYNTVVLIKSAIYIAIYTRFFSKNHEDINSKHLRYMHLEDSTKIYFCGQLKKYT